MIFGKFPQLLFSENSHFMIFGKQKLLNIKDFFRFSLHLLSKIRRILRRTEGDVIKKYVGFDLKYTSLLLSHFNKA